MNTPAISILIPVYNTAPYIERCINSILSQSFTDFEIIAVDDGSSDSSWEKLKIMAKIDERLKIYHKENGGVSSARNLAMEHASGDWYMFVDSDDELAEDALENMYCAVNDSECDMVVGNYRRIKGEDEVIHSDKYHSVEEWSIDKIIEAYFRFKPDRFQGYIWQRMLRASVIRDNMLLYNEKLQYREEGLFQFQFLYRSKKNIMTIPNEVYVYYDRPDSAMGVVRNRFEPKHITNLDARALILDEIKQNGGNPRNVLMAKQAINKMTRILVRQMLKYNYYNLRTWRYVFLTTMRAGALFTKPE